jgi:hypothetical protein
MIARIKFSIAALLMGMGLTGCSVCQVQIWANCDSNDTKLYLVQASHYAHIGQTMDFRVTVSPDVAGYVVLDFNGQEEVLPKVGPGEYGFSRQIDISCRGRSYPIEIRAYRAAGQPDYYMDAGHVRKRSSSGDAPDQLVGSARSRLDCYQSQVTIELTTSNGQEPDWSKGQLEVFGDHDKVTKVGLGQPGKSGFTALGRDVYGLYTVFYEPLVDQIHRTGKTRAVFSIPDPSTGKTITREQWISTP